MRGRDRARGLRRNETDAERKLWYFLRDRQLGGHKFRRQHPIGPYVADFVCLDRALIVELDGGQHAEQRRYDERRTEFLGKQGFKVIRFWDNEALLQTAAVLEAILNELETRPSPQPSPRKRGEGETLRHAPSAVIPRPRRGRGPG
ncbi:MAG TPA: endonuclease domain-containing protein [Casimicrobiaceae bacterium]